MAVSDSVREAVRQRAGGLCEYCHASEAWQFVLFTIDHVLPRSLGGSDGIDNLALACRNCNERRGNRVSADDPETGEPVALFHPRQNRWQDHFIWDDRRVRILPLTSTGRATLNLLDLNDEEHQELQVRIRRRDVEDGYHPPMGDPIDGV